MRRCAFVCDVLTLLWHPACSLCRAALEAWHGDAMDCSTHNSETAGPSLLALIEAQGGDLGATLLRLAHRAAAAHRFEHARGAMQDSSQPTRAEPAVQHNTTIQSSGDGGGQR